MEGQYKKYGKNADGSDTPEDVNQLITTLLKYGREDDGGEEKSLLDLEDVDDKDKDGDVLGKVNQALNKSGLPQG